MTLKEHKKHTAMARPAMGSWGRNEWSIVGAPCGDIKMLAEKVIQALSPVYQVAYVDAQHSDEPATISSQLTAGAAMEYTDAGNQQQLRISGALNPFQHRDLFSQADLILVNGNHHRAHNQIVVIDSRKKASLQKRVEQLSNVGLFLLAEAEDDIFDFLKEALPNWQQIPLLKLNDTEKVIRFIQTELQTVKPVLNGLVLAGGKSQRMGTDKSQLDWHGKPQQYYVADLLKNYCAEVFISCRDDQKAGIDPAYAALTDTFTNLGPYGAILSAFREQPDRAWLVAACDLPLLDTTVLDELLAARSIKHLATAFESPHDGFPEPLITIWEPKSYPVLLSFLAQGYSCPRKVLINSNSYIIKPAHPEGLTNVNTPEERERVKSILEQKQLHA